MAQNITVKLNTEEGTIAIHSSVFRRIIEECATLYANTFRIGRYKGDFNEFLVRVTGTSGNDAMDFRYDKNGLHIRLKLILLIGIQTGTYSHAFIRDIKTAVQEQTSVPVSDVSLEVSGYQLKNEIVASDVLLLKE